MRRKIVSYGCISIRKRWPQRARDADRGNGDVNLQMIAVEIDPGADVLAGAHAEGDEGGGGVVVAGGDGVYGFDVVEVDADVVVVRVVELGVLAGVEFDGEEREVRGRGGVGEEAEVLAGECGGRGGCVGEEEGEAETWTCWDLR